MKYRAEEGGVVLFCMHALAKFLSANDDADETCAYRHARTL